MKPQYILLVLLLTLSACGFHLRGSQGLSTAYFSRIHIRPAAAGSVAAEVRSQLQLAGVTITPTAAAEYVLNLANESYERTVLSVSANSGKVEEYQLTLSINMSVSAAGGAALLTGEPVRAIRDYTFDENAVLGKFTEENALRQDLTRQVAARIIRRLNAVVAGKS